MFALLLPLDACWVSPVPVLDVVGVWQHWTLRGCVVVLDVVDVWPGSSAEEGNSAPDPVVGASGMLIVDRARLASVSLGSSLTSFSVIASWDDLLNSLNLLSRYPFLHSEYSAGRLPDAVHSFHSLLSSRNQPAALEGGWASGKVGGALAVILASRSLALGATSASQPYPASSLSFP